MMARSTLVSFLLLFWATSLSGEAPWVSLPISDQEELGAVARLEALGIPVLSWSTAVVEVSAFDGLKTVPVARLSTVLSSSDPRWDPWLKEVPRWFRPHPGQSLVWVPSDRSAQAAGVLVPRQTLSEEPLITGWTVVSLTLVYTAFQVVSGVVFGWPGWGERRRWLWAPVALLLLLGGLSLVLARGPVHGAKPVVGASWVQHRWFQETWPWGSRWEDYAPGKVWTFPSYERQKGRLSEVSTPLDAGSEAWLRALSPSLEPDHALRIFGSFLP